MFICALWVTLWCVWCGRWGSKPRRSLWFSPSPSPSDGKLDYNAALTCYDLREFVNFQLFAYLKQFKVSAIVPNAQKAAWPGMACCTWCSNWANAPSKTGGSYAALTTSPKSSQASLLKAELKPQNTTRSPHDHKTSNTRFDNNSTWGNKTFNGKF